MPFWLDSWAGDHAAETIGRGPNTLLIAVTTEGGHFPFELYQGVEIGGFMVYPSCSVHCLTPDAGSIAAIDVKPLGGNAFSIGVAQIGFGDPMPLTPGVHLFGVSLSGSGSQAATIATAIVDEDVPFVELPGLWGPGFLSLLRTSGTPPQTPP